MLKMEDKCWEVSTSEVVVVDCERLVLSPRDRERRLCSQAGVASHRLRGRASDVVVALERLLEPVKNDRTMSENERKYEGVREDERE